MRKCFYGAVAALTLAGLSAAVDASVVVYSDQMSIPANGAAIVTGNTGASTWSSFNRIYDTASNSTILASSGWSGYVDGSKGNSAAEVQTIGSSSFRNPTGDVVGQGTTSATPGQEIASNPGMGDGSVSAGTPTLKGGIYLSNNTYDAAIYTVKPAIAALNLSPVEINLLSIDGSTNATTTPGWNEHMIVDVAGTWYASTSTYSFNRANSYGGAGDNNNGGPDWSTFALNPASTTWSLLTFTGTVPTTSLTNASNFEPAGSAVAWSTLSGQILGVGISTEGSDKASGNSLVVTNYEISVPEPMSVSVLAIGLLGASMRRRRA